MCFEEKPKALVCVTVDDQKVEAPPARRTIAFVDLGIELAFEEEEENILGGRMGKFEDTGA